MEGTEQSLLCGPRGFPRPRVLLPLGCQQVGSGLGAPRWVSVATGPRRLSPAPAVPAGWLPVPAGGGATPGLDGTTDSPPGSQTPGRETCDRQIHLHPEQLEVST